MRENMRLQHPFVYARRADGGNLCRALWNTMRSPRLRMHVRVWYRRSRLKESDENNKWFGLLRRRPCWIPTWRAWSILLIVIIGLGWVGTRKIYSFLAVNDPHPGGWLVVEGWAPDY